MAAAAMLFVGCSKDDDKTTTDDTFTVAKVNCTYKLLVETPNPAALRKAYNLFIDFYDSVGEIQTTQEFISADLHWQIDLVGTTFPSWYGFRFRFSPKADLSDVDSTASFDIVAAYSIEGVCTGTNGTTKLFGTEGVLDRSGITPFVDVTYSEARRFEVKSDGTAEVDENWVE